MNEQWGDIPGYEGFFQVSSAGRVKSLNRSFIGANGQVYHFAEKIRSASMQNSGYLTISLVVKSKERRYLVHRLVALTFLDNPLGHKYVNHKNGVKTDNRRDNLEWCTQSDNVKHAFKNGLNKVSEKSLARLRKYNSETKKIPVSQYSKVGEFIAAFSSCSEASGKTGLDFSSICACASMKYRGHNTCGGYVWQYTGSPFVSPAERRKLFLTGNRAI